MTIAFPNEPADYRAARDELLGMELELRRMTERVAEARRALPKGGPIQEDYAFDDMDESGATAPVRLSQLFAPGQDTLLLYNMMFPRDPGDHRPGPAQGATASVPLHEGPCPSCVALLDQLDGAAFHLAPHASFAVVAKAPIERLAAFGRERGWRNLRLVSSARNSFKRDYHAETSTGAQRPMMTVFHRDGDRIQHFWSSELLYAPTDPGQDPRHVGTIEAVWNLFDMTPEGRGQDRDEQLSYPPCCHAAP